MNVLSVLCSNASKSQVVVQKRNLESPWDEALQATAAPLIILFLRDPTAQWSKQFLKIRQLKNELRDFGCQDSNHD